MLQRRAYLQSREYQTLQSVFNPAVYPPNDKKYSVECHRDVHIMLHNTIQYSNKEFFSIENVFIYFFYRILSYTLHITYTGIGTFENRRCRNWMERAVAIVFTEQRAFMR